MAAQGTGDEAVRLGLTGRLDTLQAAILLAKLEVFDDELARRREIAMRYDGMLYGAVTVPTIPDGYESAFALYTIRVPDRDARAGAARRGRHRHGALLPPRPAPASGIPGPRRRGPCRSRSSLPTRFSACRSIPTSTIAKSIASSPP